MKMLGEGDELGILGSIAFTLDVYFEDMEVRV